MPSMNLNIQCVWSLIILVNINFKYLSNEFSYFESHVEMVPRLCHTLSRDEPKYTFVLLQSNYMLLYILFFLLLVEWIRFKQQLIVLVVECKVNQAAACILLGFNRVQQPYSSNNSKWTYLFFNFGRTFVLKVSFQTISQFKIIDCPSISFYDTAQLQCLFVLHRPQHYLFCLLCAWKLSNNINTPELLAWPAIRIWQSVV